MSYTDLRVIMFGRNMLLDGAKCNLPEFCHIPIETKWISLGHFDSIFVYPLFSDSYAKINHQTAAAYNDSGSEQNAEHMLSVIGQHNMYLSQESRGDDYYHPLYVVRAREDKEKETVDSFWAWDSCFMQITRVHCAQQGDLTQLEKRLATFLRESGARPYHEKTLDSVKFICYRAFDLSDIVIFMKSNTFLPLAEILKVLYADKVTHDLYTHYAVNYKLLDGEANSFDEKDLQRLRNDWVPYIAVRFSVQNPHIAQNYITNYTELLDAPAYVVTGTDDVSITKDKLPVPSLLELLRGWMKNKSTEGENYLRNAFSDVITRIGVRADCEKTEKLSYEDNLLTKAYLQIMDNFMKIQDECYSINNFDYGVKHSWLRPTHELLNSLVNLSRSCVLSDLGYILYDGVRCFCEKIKDLPNNEADYPVISIQRFINSWSQMMELIVRMEGQMIKQPESRPLLYDVPPRLLELNIAFAKRYAEYLLKMDESPRSISLFIVPNLCERISAHDEMSFVGNEEQLVFVDLPIHLIYNPFAVACNLCHEVGHFCGEEVRNRQERFYYFIFAAASLIAWQLGMKSERIIGKIARDLNQGFFDKTLFPSQGDNQPERYMKEITNRIKALSKGIMGNTTYIAELRDLYCAAMPSAQERIAWLDQSSRQVEETAIYDISIGIGTMHNLFRECYADMTMIFSLGITADEYLSLFDQEFRSCQYTQAALAEVVQRVAAVLTVVDPEWPKPSSDTGSVLATTVSLYLKFWADSSTDKTHMFSNSRYLPAQVMNSLVDYLNTCMDAMNKATELPNVKQYQHEIVDMFQVFARKQQLDNELFDTFMSNYRSTVI